MNGIERFALKAYPPSFRARYGDELEAVLTQLPASRATAADLLLGAGRAWLHPRFTGAAARQRRQRASISTTWVAWCAGFMVAPALNKALLDTSGRAVDPAVRALVDIGAAAFAAGWLCLVVGAAVLLARVYLPALRSHRRRLLTPLAPALILGALLLAGLASLVGAGLTGARPPGTALSWFVLWLVGLAAFLCCLGIGPAVSLTRLPECSGDELRLPGLAAVVASVCLAVMTGCGIAAVVVSGHATLMRSQNLVIAVLIVAAGASLVALTSSFRGTSSVARAL